jgi:hypothetical protein
MASAIPNPSQVTFSVAVSEVIDRTEEAAQLGSLAEESNSARVVAHECTTYATTDPFRLLHAIIKIVR